MLVAVATAAVAVVEVAMVRNFFYQVEEVRKEKTQAGQELDLEIENTTCRYLRKKNKKNKKNKTPHVVI